MEKSFLYIVLLCISIPFFSCSSNGTHDNIHLSSTFENLKIDTTPNPKNLSEIVTGIQYIPLQSSNANLIGKVDKVDYFQDLLFVLDKKISKALFVFDKSGKFIYKKKANEADLNRIETISDFSIDKSKKILYLYSSDSRQIIQFALPGGEYLRRLKIKGYFSGISSLDSGQFVLLRDGLTKYDDKYDNERICLFDSTGKATKSWMERPLNDFVSAGTIMKDQSPMGKELLVCRMFNDTIYSLNKSRLEARYKLPLASDISSIRNEKEIKSFMNSPSSSFATGESIFNTNKYLGIYVKKGDFVCLLLYDKIKKDGSIIKMFKNDVDKVAFPMIHYMDDSCLLFLLEPVQLQQQYHIFSNAPDFNTKYDQLIKLNSLISLRSNPVLAIAKLK